MPQNPGARIGPSAPSDGGKENRLAPYNPTLEEQVPAATEPRRAGAPGVNVAIVERLASAAAGGLLIPWGLRKRSPGGLALAALGADLLYRGLTGHCALYRFLGINTAASARPGSLISANAPEVHRSITIGKSPEELSGFWRDPVNLARIMAHFAEVTPKSPGVTHWRVNGPLKQIFEWDSRQAEEQPGRKLSWQTLPGSSLPNRGEVTFNPAPGNIGTEVTLRMQFEPPLGSVGAGLVKTLHKLPRGITGKALRRFKSLAETGEIPTLADNPSGRGSSDVF